VKNTPKTGSSMGLVAAAALLLYLFAIVRKAWIGDDAFITLRAVDNFVHGYGLLSNPPERVQGFTNLLWALLLAIPTALKVPGYVAAIGTGLLTSTVAALWITGRAAASPACAALAALWLLCSEAYVDFSTGGLENPLAHLLLAIFFTQFIGRSLKPRRVYPWAMAALIILNRYDHVLLIAPALIVLLFEAYTANADIIGLTWRKLIRRVTAALLPAALGFSPLLLWFGWSIVYYGFPFPNTAYAKLNAEIPLGEFIAQGFWYVIDSVQRDPLTLLVVALGLVAMAQDRTRMALATGTGVIFYLCYVVYIGGDFMAGRFFTAPFVVCLTWLVARGFDSITQGQIAAIAAGSAVLGIVFSGNLSTNDKYDCPYEQPSGIVSERKCYAELMGLPENIRIATYKTHRAYKRGLDQLNKKRRVAAMTSVGMAGYAAGPTVHVIDQAGLTDPLLARIPYRPKGGFRIGHFLRDVPGGYEATISTGRNELSDPCLHAYYDVLARVIRGPLFSRERWTAIMGLNFGRYDYLMAQPCPLLSQAEPK
jgi:arabinofuranosyltransferase